MKREEEIEKLRERGLVWHYTTLDVLQLILESKTFLATEVSYQNDPREPETAHDAVDRALEELENTELHSEFARSAKQWLAQYRKTNGFIDGRMGELVNDARFILCASTDPDNMYAWRTYGAGTRMGCAIGIDPEIPLGVVGDPSRASDTSVSAWREVKYEGEVLHSYAVEVLGRVGDNWNGARERDVDYIRTEQDKGIDPRTIHDPDSEFDVLLWDFSEAQSEIAAVAKHRSFIDERESRVTVSDVNSGLLFTPGSDGPRPRVRIGTAVSDSAVLEAAGELLPIRAIVLSPSSSRQAATTVNWLLYANGYPIDPVMVVEEGGDGTFATWDANQAVRVHRSAHPYRDV